MTISLLQTSDFSPKSFDQAAKALAKKAALSSEDFERLAIANRAHAFRIAGVHNAAVVQQIRDAITRGLREGDTFAQIREELLKLFDTGGIPRPSLNRLRFAFEEQTRQAYATARDQALDTPETAATFSFWQYRTLGDRRVRPEHDALDGKVFRVADKSVARFRPPWDFGCRCQRMPLTEGQVKRERLTVWTYGGGSFRPVDRKIKRKGLRIAPNPKYDRSSKRLRLSGLDADLRRLVEELTGT